MQQQHSPGPLWTFPEVLEYLRVSRSTLYRLMRAGTLTGHKIGATWRFYAGDVRACVERDDAPVIVTMSEQAFADVMEEVRSV